jgi:hypothetical protein
MFPFLNREGIGHISLPKEEKRNVQDVMFHLVTLIQIYGAKKIPFP